MFRRLITGTLALLFTIGVIGGAPVLLLRVAGNPLPSTMPTWDQITQLLLSPDNGDLFLRVLTWIGWLAWATFTISVLVEIPAQIRGRRARRIPGLGMQQKVAGALVGSMIALFIGTSVAHAAVAAPVVKPVPVLAFTAPPGPAQSHDWKAPLTTRAVDAVTPGAATAKPVVPQAYALSPVPQGPAGGSQGIARISAGSQAPAGASQALAGQQTSPGAQALAGPQAPGPQAAPGGAQAAAEAKAAGLAALFSGAKAGAGAATPGTVVANAATGTVAANAATPGTVAANAAAHPSAAATAEAQQAQMVYVVKKGDYLGRIALRFTGDFDCYREIAKLNPQIIKNPNHIEPGWKLILPADAVDRGIIRHATGTVLTPGATPAPTPSPPPAPTPPPSPSPEAPTPPPPVVEQPTERPTERPSTDPQLNPGEQQPAAESKDDVRTKALAAGAGLAAASVLAAHVILHRRQLRETQVLRRRRRRVTKVFMPSVESAAVEKAARQMAKHRAVDRIDATLRSLALGLRGRDTSDMPDIAAAWQAGGDVALILTSPCDDPPEPFEERWQNTWSLGANVRLPESSWAPALLPGLLTFATWPQGGDLLVDTERTGLLTITGDPQNSAALLRALAAEAATAAWADSASVLLAGLDPQDMVSLSTLNPSRVRTTASIPEALARISKRAAANASILRETQTPDTMVARINNHTEGFWATHVLFIADPWGEHSQAIRELDAELAGLKRVGVTVIATHPTATRWSATVGTEGSLHMAWLAVAGANARNLSAEELAAQAELGT